MQTTSNILQAIMQLQAGKMIVLVDDENRENEGDLVLAAEFSTPENINFMIKKAGGIVCVSVEESFLQKFNIPMQPVRRSNALAANFSVSIDAIENISTGICAADRAKTILTLLDKNSTADSIATPGHVFPLCAKPYGVLERRGHTEGSVDIMKIASLNPAAVIVEILDENGGMLRGKALIDFAKNYDLPMISVEEIVRYRLANENWVEKISSTILSTRRYGNLSLSVFKNILNSAEDIVVLHAPNFKAQNPSLVRLHSSCFTGDVLSSTQCDCESQLEESLKKIIAENGLLIYLPQEGRNIGLANKIKAYALQKQGLDTVEANIALGFADDARDYASAAHILKYFNIQKVHLLTNNPRKTEGLIRYGIRVEKRIPLEIQATEDNYGYLKTKQQKLHHHLGVTL